jgi:uncharacterized membrane protein YccF (DUF307 family)
MNGVKNYGGINDTLFWVFVGLACASPAFLLPASRSRGKLPSFAVFYPKGDSAVTGRQ